MDLGDRPRSLVLGFLQASICDMPTAAADKVYAFTAIPTLCMQGLQTTH
jgi:hypothetical protein